MLFVRERIASSSMSSRSRSWSMGWMEVERPRDRFGSGAREVDVLRRETLVVRVVPADWTCARFTNVGVRSRVVVWSRARS